MSKIVNTFGDALKELERGMWVRWDGKDIKKGEKGLVYRVDTTPEFWFEFKDYDNILFMKDNIIVYDGNSKADVFWVKFKGKTVRNKLTHTLCEVREIMSCDNRFGDAKGNWGDISDEWEESIPDDTNIALALKNEKWFNEVKGKWIRWSGWHRDSVGVIPESFDINNYDAFKGTDKLTYHINNGFEIDHNGNQWIWETKIHRSGSVSKPMKDNNKIGEHDIKDFYKDITYIWEYLDDDKYTILTSSRMTEEEAFLRFINIKHYHKLEWTRGG